MKKLFWTSPYQDRLATTVAFVDGASVLLESTIAYSFSGGQESDKAWINDLAVLDSKMCGTDIFYILPDDHGLKIGDTVIMRVDWLRRTRLMRLHFAAELVLEIVTQKWGFEKLGAHIAEHKARIDFRSEEPITGKLAEIVSAYNEIIEKNFPIEKGFTDVVNQKRYWKITGFAQVPCGGTHVDSTGEIGFVKLKREHPGKSVERIEIRLIDDAALPSRNGVI